MIPVFRGFVERGRLLYGLNVDRPTEFRRYLQTLSGAVEIIVRRPRTMRSTPQNAYYWSVVIPLLGEHFGYLPDAMHEAMKHLFLRTTDPDKPLPIIRSTASLTVQEFEQYLETIRLWAATDHQCIIPLPNEVDDA